MCERAAPFGEGELRNNNQPCDMLDDADANANDIHGEDGERTRDTETTEQDKVVIWGTDSQCDDPELAEFEMLECQELEACLVEDEEDYIGLVQCKEPQDHLPCRKTLADLATDNKSREEKRCIVRNASEQESIASETDVFLSCLSTVSSMVTAVDTLGKSHVTDSWHAASGPHSTISEDLTLAEQGKADPSSFAARTSTTHHRELDMNLNSTVNSDDVAAHSQVINGVLCTDSNDEHKKNNNQRNRSGDMISGECIQGRNVDNKALLFAKSHEEDNGKTDKSTQADESPGLNCKPARTGTKASQSFIEPRALKKQGSFDNTLRKQNSFDRSVKRQPSFESSLKKQLSFDNSLKKQRSFDNTIPSSSSSLERRRPWGSPSRLENSAVPKTTFGSPKRGTPGSPAKVQGVRTISLERSASPYRGTSQTAKPFGKATMSSGIPKPVMPQQKEPEIRSSSSPQKPKNIRPKIITYVRKNTQGKPQVPEVSPHVYETSTHSPSISSYSGPQVHKDPKSTAVLCSSNLLFDKYRQEIQRTGGFPPGMKPPSNTTSYRLGRKLGSFHEESLEKYYQEAVIQEEGTTYRSGRALRPQLGLAAVNRPPAAKGRVQQSGQRGSPAQGQLLQGVRVSAQGTQDLGEQKRSCLESNAKGQLLKSGQSGLRPPGFSALPPARLAVLGFGRSSDPSSGSDDSDVSSVHMRPHPPSAPSLQRRSLPPQNCSPIASRRELQKDTEASTKGSPKRFPMVSPKPQSPVCGRPAAAPQGANRAQDLNRVLIQQLRQRCEWQELQLQTLQAQLKKASLCLDVFTITTQHFCDKSERAVVKERELSLELNRIRDEVASSVAHWEKLQREKEEVERRFEAELLALRSQQQVELRGLEERLKAQHMEETENLQADQRAELEELRFKQQEQLEEMTENHEASLMELESTHNGTVATLQDEHARTVKNLTMAHEQQRKSLEEEFEKIRLSLQDQVDTLTFQNRSLRERAKRFEEALRKSTDEQIVDALAPYKHIDEDLKSLKEVLEMKNQQIHQQEQKISELEKIAEKNVFLEEKLQVLQQQNEDLKERIDKNLAVSRQLSEENANLQVNVEKESNEKKRLSRTNEELMWRLQTGELSPRMSPSSSPIHRPPSLHGSPARPHSYHQ
ncbi:microtubule-associated tumor suppressor candidate 2 homolog isoform X2 [Gouania willdenowi]|uniref:microtubule-associated tumor suppressor candidate 2 homolog isoform X2 n=1 Tax=Gouania willdenowi TaxID=441366 RepID=UPI001056E059|nr:microtubule-associated tumor suppressor candidate 2 homolog isoform X2 [Gouania willdenowi]